MITSDPIFDRFLNAQVRLAAALEAANPALFSIAPVPIPGLAFPPMYRVAVQCKSLRRDPGGPVQELDGEVVFGIQFSPAYCRRVEQPVVRILTTGIWHPNIGAQTGDVCLGIRPSTPVTDLVVSTYGLIIYLQKATGHPLNHEAAAWARSQPQDRFPLEHRMVRIPEPAFP